MPKPFHPVKDLIEFQVKVGNFFNQNTQDPIAWLGRTLRFLTDTNEGGCFTAAALFGTLVYKGGKDLFTLYTDTNKWLEFRERFKSKKTITPQFENIQPRIMGPKDLETVQELKDAEIIEQLRLVEKELVEIEHADVVAAFDALGFGDDSQAAFNTITNNLGLANQYLNAMQDPNFVQALQHYRDLLATQEEAQHIDLQPEIEAQREWIAHSDASRMMERIRYDMPQIRENTGPADILRMIAQLEDQRLAVQEILDHVQGARDTHKQAIDNTKKKKEAYDKLPSQVPAGKVGGTYAVTLKETKTKKSEDEWHIPIPLSNDALVIHHKAFKKAVTKSVLGYGEMTIGVLGVMDQIASKYKTIPDTPILILARSIGLPARLVLNGASYGAKFLLEPESSAYALGNLALFGGLSYAGVQCIKQTNFTWFHWAPKPGEKWFNGGQFIKDCAWTTVGLLALSTALTIGKISIQSKMGPDWPHG